MKIGIGMMMALASRALSARSIGHSTASETRITNERPKDIEPPLSRQRRRQMERLKKKGRA
ncbi:hypothetical protein DL1_08515 [Thioclava dalianensis]|uniref:Uncharacterized protein n=1 Tax=Thioclava dalianensis TaxID=1185766 RepID=A0A074TIJ9_9RHOB|nr:hypothetical protein [Thioclava dalianensis]KEP68818.1 hypothetical protein DL1_08515 [Thioclava dalianensis]SFN50009.1 hypothetical protein SAMN05216224_10684 [Thioclava dalianensis]